MTNTKALDQSGSGSVTYSIGDQTQAKASCSFRVVKSPVGSLRLQIHIEDAAYGGVSVTAQLDDYSHAQSVRTLSGVALCVTCQAPAGTWISGPESSGSLFLKDISKTSEAVYVGSLSAENLKGQGSNGKPELAFRFVWFILSTKPTDALALPVNADGGDGWATVTCQVGTNPVQTAFTGAGMYLTDGNLFSLAASWPDPVYGSLYLILFITCTGGGIYDSSQMQIIANIEPQGVPWSNSMWSNNDSPSLAPGVVMNLICTPTSWCTLMQASLSIKQLPWIHNSSVADQGGLSLSLSAFAYAPAVTVTT